MITAKNKSRSINFALLLCLVSVPILLSGCSGVVSSSADAATKPPVTIALSAPQPRESLPPPTLPTPIITVPPPQAVVVAVAPLDVPLVAVGKKDGAETARVQQRLLDLGFWLQSSQGEYGVTTAQAVMAFQKYVGLEASAAVDEATAQALTSATTKAHGETNTGTLIEVDKDLQLLFIVQDAVTVWTINVSTGSGIAFKERDKNEWGKWVWGDSQTPDGIFKINREVEKGWRAGDLGDIYRPKYFNVGIGLHGAYQVPNYPASHGCVRMSTPAMDFIWAEDLAPMGMKIWVHSDPPVL